MNNDHNIHLCVQYMAERIAYKRDRTTAMDIHKTNADEVAEESMDALRAMPSWLWNDYVVRVRAKGYSLVERPDKKGVLKGYTVGKDDVIYKAPELGKGRKLMASKSEAIWRKLHNQSETKSIQPTGITGTKPVTPVTIKPMTLSDKPVADYSSWHNGTSRYELTHDGKTYLFYIPDNVVHVFNDEFDYRETMNRKELGGRLVRGTDCI